MHCGTIAKYFRPLHTCLRNIQLVVKGEGGGAGDGGTGGGGGAVGEENDEGGGEEEGGGRGGAVGVNEWEKGRGWGVVYSFHA